MMTKCEGTATLALNSARKISTFFKAATLRAQTRIYSVCEGLLASRDLGGAKHHLSFNGVALG